MNNYPTKKFLITDSALLAFIALIGLLGTAFVIIDGLFYSQRIEATDGFFFFFLIFAILQIKNEKKGKVLVKKVICLECLKQFERNSVYESKCIYCGGEVEPSIGFYERHPDLKIKEQPEPDS